MKFVCEGKQPLPTRCTEGFAPWRVYVLLTTCFRSYLVRGRNTYLNKLKKYVFLKDFMSISWNAYVLMELCLSEMRVESSICWLLSVIPSSLLCAPLCFYALFSSLMFLCLHIYFCVARRGCLQIVALACKSTWPFSSYSPYQSNANSSVPISNSWEKESSAPEVTCPLLAGEEGSGNAEMLLSGHCEGCLRNGLQEEVCLSRI